MNLIFLALIGGVYAFFGFNLLPLIFFNNTTAVRSFLAICFVSALFEIYLLLVFKPFKGMK
ncbi:MAG: hypothetical protein ACI4MS_02030 [Candidatus Coproplasma sp.]